MTVAPPAIETIDLRKVYGTQAAVDGLNSIVPSGSFFGFLGPNRAGKTTTIRMLTGLAPPTSGTIQLLGLPMPDHEIEAKRQIGLVPDESLLFDHLTGPEFLEFAGRMYGLQRVVARERARELMSLFSSSTEASKSSLPITRKACESGSRWRRRSSTGPGCFSSTNRLKASMQWVRG